MSGQKEEMQGIVDSMPSVPILNKAFRNKGHLKFSDEGLNWGFSKPSFSNGAAYGDLDNDGDLDLVVSNVNMPCFVYKNNSREINKSHYISFQLEGKSSNKFAVGAKIQLSTDSGTLIRELIPTRGFQSSSDYKMIFGLGTRKVYDAVISWPDSSEMHIDHPSIDKNYFIKQSNADVIVTKPPALYSAPLFKEEVQQFEKHTEDSLFVDYYVERNIPVMLSREGPKAAVADVNKMVCRIFLLVAQKARQVNYIFKAKIGL